MATNKNLPAQPLPEQVSSSTLHEVRKELSDKIETRVPIWIFTLVAAAFGCVILYLNSQINLIKDDKLTTIQERITVLETLSNLHQNNQIPKP